jgi:predicted dehydrogenase
MTSISRRDFTRTALAASASTALSRSRVLGANGRIRLGLIGSGDRGQQIWKIFLQQAEAQAVAVCDVYDLSRNQGEQMATAAGGTVKTFGDYRRVLEMKDVDAVVIGTPDHWHALPTIHACQAGKDVYCEKPLSLFVREGRAMVNAARKYNRVVQTGSQQRSAPHYIEAVKLIQEGGIGAVHKITVGYTRNAMPGFKPVEGLTAEQPKGLDWDMWLGPAPKVPYDPFRFMYNFRWFWDYSGGQMTNWGAHNLDIARWMLNAQGPRAVSAFGGRYAIKDGGETPDVQEVIYDFGNCVVTWSGREVNHTRDEYLSFHGTNATLSILRNGYQITPEPWRKKPATVAAKEVKAAPNEMQAIHIRNFLECVKSRQRPNADVEEGHLTAVVCHLGNIATRLNRGLQWDVAKEDFKNDKEASAILSRPYRAPWKLA